MAADAASAQQKQHIRGFRPLRAGYLTFEQIEAAKAATPGRAPSIRRGRRAA
jgi:hypothetical protein